MTREDAARRIELLGAMTTANGCTPAEAATAARLASEISTAWGAPMPEPELRTVAEPPPRPSWSEPAPFVSPIMRRVRPEPMFTEEDLWSLLEWSLSRSSRRA